MRFAAWNILGTAGLTLLLSCGGGVRWAPAPVGDDALRPPPPTGEAGTETDAFGSDDDDAAAPSAQASIDLGPRIAQFAPATIQADLSHLAKSERAALDKLIEASKLLDPIFDRQAYAGYPALRAKLEADTTAAGKQRLEYFRIMRGPWDRQDHFKPFAVTASRPAGAGFYPENLTVTELDSYLAKHPNQRKDIESLFTVVQRYASGLRATPYSKAYAQWLVPAAAKLREAAKLTKNKALRTFLDSRAAAFGSDDYYRSDLDWMDLDGAVEITIGPYEVYEDKLKALKASFESFVTVTDPAASKKLSKYKGMLADMEKNLPIPEAMKTVRGKKSPIRVVDLVFAAGDARKSVQTIAFNLPNDERVRKAKGSKKVLLRNVIAQKFDLIMRPIAERIIDTSQLEHLSSDAFFNETLFHELSHGLGPAYTKRDGKKVEVRVALGASYSVIEEAKADVMGAYNILYMIRRGEMPKSFRKKLLVSYFAGLFRSVRFGVSESHGKGAALQINRFLEDGAAQFHARLGRYTVDYAKLEKAIERLVRDLCVLQDAGDKAAVDAMLAKYGVMSPSMRQALDKVADIPVDLRPRYPAAGE